MMPSGRGFSGRQGATRAAVSAGLLVQRAQPRRLVALKKGRKPGEFATAGLDAGHLAQAVIRGMGVADAG